MKNGKQNIVHNKVIQQQESQRPAVGFFIYSVCSSRNANIPPRQHSHINTHQKGIKITIG